MIYSIFADFTKDTFEPWSNHVELKICPFRRYWPKVHEKCDKISKFGDVLYYDFFGGDDKNQIFQFSTLDF